MVVWGGILQGDVVTPRELQASHVQHACSLNPRAPSLHAACPAWIGGSKPALSCSVGLFCMKLLRF